MAQDYAYKKHDAEYRVESDGIHVYSQNTVQDFEYRLTVTGTCGLCGEPTPEHPDICGGGPVGNNQCGQNPTEHGLVGGARR